MKRKIIFLILVVLFVSLLCSCSNRTEKPGCILIDIEYYRDFPVTYSEYRKLLFKNYNMSYEEMGDIDVAKFVTDFDLYYNPKNLTEENVKDTFLTMRQYYEGNKYAPFVVFDYENIKGQLPSDYKAKGIGVMAVKVQTNNEKPEMTVYVIESNTHEEDNSLYKDTKESERKVCNSISLEYIEMLNSIIDNAEIYNWEEENNESPDGFSWDLIFILSDGTFARYTGLNSQYAEVLNSLLNIDKQ